MYWHGHRPEYHEGYSYDEHGSGDGERCSSGELKYSTRHDVHDSHFGLFNYGQPTAEMKCHGGVMDELVLNAGQARRATT